MRLRIISLFLLIIFRVFLVPTWFACHIEEIKDASETFEHIRLKKRRSSYLEENPSSIDLSLSRAAISSQIKRVQPFCPEITGITGSSQQPDGWLHFISCERCLPLYLHNRVLRI